ncbi:MAG: acyl-CoA thioesterase II [Deltaproteobacteria bacterium]|nr:acyl-CoA thioesterase II [Deltaproteobacteria bacterium]MBW2362815.1 acyl-CoA thioesterase II [Deltaproteobacteria bacterium]
MQKALDDLVGLLDLEAIEVNVFRGQSPQDGSQRVFGGQVLGQAMVAAGRTAPGEDEVLHSLHAYFLRPGDPSIPILYQVDRTKDGRAFATRRIVAVQRGQAIFQMEASFHRPERGFEHQDEMPDVPDPDELPTMEERLASLVGKARNDDDLRLLSRERAIDSRYVTQVDMGDPKKLPPRLDVWIRANGSLPDEPPLHQCVVAYASDMTLLDTAMLPHAIGWFNDSCQVATLDHAMWLHGDFRADDWLLYSQHSPAAAAGRAFSTGRLFTRDGRLVASMVQEGLIRPTR